MKGSLLIKVDLINEFASIGIQHGSLNLLVGSGVKSQLLIAKSNRLGETKLIVLGCRRVQLELIFIAQIQGNFYLY
jgi:hypothetical protein